MGFFSFSVPGSAPVWLHRVNLLSDRRAVRIEPTLFVKPRETREKILKDLLHPETNYFSAIFGEKLFSPISAGGKKIDVSSCTRATTFRIWRRRWRRIKNIKYLPQIFHPMQLGSFSFLFFLSRLESAVSVFITQIIHTSVKVTRWNILPTSKIQHLKGAKPVA